MGVLPFKYERSLTLIVIWRSAACELYASCAGLYNAWCEQGCNAGAKQQRLLKYMYPIHTCILIHTYSYCTPETHLLGTNSRDHSAVPKERSMHTETNVYRMLETIQLSHRPSVTTRRVCVLDLEHSVGWRCLTP